MQSVWLLSSNILIHKQICSNWYEKAKQKEIDLKCEIRGKVNNEKKSNSETKLHYTFLDQCKFYRLPENPYPNASLSIHRFKSHGFLVRNTLPGFSQCFHWMFIRLNLTYISVNKIQTRYIIICVLQSFHWFSFVAVSYRALCAAFKFRFILRRRILLCIASHRFFCYVWMCVGYWR